MPQGPSITMFHLSRRGFVYWDYIRLSAVLLLADLFDATSDRIAQDLATLFGTRTGFCMNTISGDKTQLPSRGGRSGALPFATPGRSGLRFIPVNHSMPAPAPANPFRHRFWDSFADKRPVIDIKLPDFLFYILKVLEKSGSLLSTINSR